VNFCLFFELPAILFSIPIALKQRESNEKIGEKIEIE